MLSSFALFGVSKACFLGSSEVSGERNKRDVRSRLECSPESNPLLELFPDLIEFESSSVQIYKVSKDSLCYAAATQVLGAHRHRREVDCEDTVGDEDLDPEWCLSARKKREKEMLTEDLEVRWDAIQQCPNARDLQRLSSVTCPERRVRFEQELPPDSHSVSKVGSLLSSLVARSEAGSTVSSSSKSEKSGILKRRLLNLSQRPSLNGVFNSLSRYTTDYWNGLLPDRLRSHLFDRARLEDMLQMVHSGQELKLGSYVDCRVTLDQLSCHLAIYDSALKKQRLWSLPLHMFDYLIFDPKSSSTLEPSSKRSRSSLNPFSSSSKRKKKESSFRYLILFDAAGNCLMFRCPRFDASKEPMYLDVSQKSVKREVLLSSDKRMIEKYLCTRDFPMEYERLRHKLINQKSNVDLMRQNWMSDQMLSCMKQELFAMDSQHFNRDDCSIHCREFQFQLKMLLQQSKDIRTNDRIPSSQASSRVSKCQSNTCDREFGSFSQWRYTCEVCGRVVCSECKSSDYWPNVVLGKMDVCCKSCFTEYNRLCNDFARKSGDDCDPFSRPFQSVLQHYLSNDSDQRQAIESVDWRIARESAWLSYRIYESDLDTRPALMHAFGFRVHRVAKFADESQFVQYAFVESVTTNVMYVVFRGSLEFLDWVANANAVPLHIEEYGFRVHSGIYAQLQNGVFERVFQLIKDELSELHCTTVVLSGHSLGGAYSILCACEMLSRMPKCEISVFTFGAPLVIEKGAKMKYLGLKLFNKVHNFVHQFDIIPRVQRGMSIRYLSLMMEKVLDSRMGNLSKIIRPEWLIQKINAKPMHSMIEESYAPFGRYFGLFDYYPPMKMVGSPLSSILHWSEPSEFLRLLPKPQAMFPSRILGDHSLDLYCSALFHLVFPHQGLQDFIDHSYILVDSLKSSSLLSFKVKSDNNNGYDNTTNVDFNDRDDYSLL